MRQTHRPRRLHALATWMDNTRKTWVLLIECKCLIALNERRIATPLQLEHYSDKTFINYVKHSAVWWLACLPHSSEIWAFRWGVCMIAYWLFLIYSIFVFNLKVLDLLSFSWLIYSTSLPSSIAASCGAWLIQAAEMSFLHRVPGLSSRLRRVEPLLFPIGKSLRRWLRHLTSQIASWMLLGTSNGEEATENTQITLANVSWLA